jgi:hypothetical protein
MPSHIFPTIVHRCRVQLRGNTKTSSAFNVIAIVKTSLTLLRPNVALDRECWRKRSR